MADSLKVALAQLDLVVGDVAGNTERIIACANRARDDDRADLVVFPELAVSGYPPEDLLFHAGLARRVAEGVSEIRASVRDVAVLVGYPRYENGAIYNACSVYLNGSELANYRKQLLPNYSVFDEERYFEAGKDAAVFTINNVRLGINICEDVWGPAPAAAARAAGAEVLIAINGSPYDQESQHNREQVVRARIKEVGIPTVYLNMVGGQDELVFDGGSFVMDADGHVRHRASAFSECVETIELTASPSGVEPRGGRIVPELDAEASVYEALVTGTRDYVRKNGFPGVILGLSGGVDSALTAAIACDALGADKVRAVMMPFKFTSTMSQEDAARQAQTQGIRYDVLPIAPIYDAVTGQLSTVFEDREVDVTEENIQARCRGILLMAISNKTGRMLLTTGNKSEMAVGYATLYGDMAGGFAPLKDCSKMLVYRLARYRNTVGEVIPPRVIEREPSAELRADQRDTDSLPPYEVLDPILAAFMEEDLSVAEIVERGFERDVVIRILELVKRNEYKRRQAPPGIRISRRAFGRDWRYPITSKYRFPE
ncbi:MAG: NAD+ synthase [Pseudomonadota bacterium]